MIEFPIINLKSFNPVSIIGEDDIYLQIWMNLLIWLIWAVLNELYFSSTDSNKHNIMQLLVLIKVNT